MATGQVVGRHEVFEYTYKVGPAEERKRIKLVVIQRRDQRRKSLIAAQKYLESAPVKLRVNLHRAQYGDPEVTSGSRQVPITLRRKIKPAARTTTRVIRAPPQARAAHGLLTPPHTAPPPPEPARIELVDRPVPPPPSDSPGILYAEPDPIVVVPSSDHGHSHGHGRDSPSPPPVPPSPSSSSISVNRPGKVKRSNSFGSSFRRFPSLMGLIRRNSKNTTTPPTVTTTVETHHAPGYFDHDAPRSPGSRDMIIEERDSELGSPVGGPVGYGPPSVAGSRIGRKPVPPIPDSPPVSVAPSSTRSRTFSLGRRPSVSGSPRNRLVKASPRHVPLPDSVRDPSIGGSPFVTGGFPAESHDGRSVRSRRTERSVHQTPEYVHDEYLHNSPSAHSRSLRDPSIVHHEHGREPSITQLSMRDGSVVNGDRSLQLHGGESFNERSMHGDRSLHGGERSLHGGDRSMHNGSDHRSSGRSLQGHSLHNRSAHDLPSDGYRSPSIPDLPTRDRASSDGGENDHGQWSPRSGSVSDLHRGASPSLQAPSHISSHRGSHDPSHRGVSPSLHAPAPLSQRTFSPSLQDPHSRGASPLSHGHSRREGSPSIHALSHRDGSPSIHGHTHRDQSHSRGASPSLHAPSYHGTNGNGNGTTYSPPESMHAPSVKSRAASSVASSKVPMSSIGGRFSSRPKSPLSASGSSHASSRMTNRPSGPEITPVPSNGAPSTHAPSVASHRTGASRNVVRSPLARTDEAPAPPSKAPSVAGSHRSGRASEARTTRSSASRRRI